MSARRFRLALVSLMYAGSAAGSSDDHRKRRAQEAEADRDAQRLQTRTAIGTSIASCPNKTWLIKTLTALQATGSLNMTGSLRQHVRKSSVDNSRAITPYGPVVQTLDLGDEKCVRGLEYVNPFLLCCTTCGG